jgi:hypothetical protein
MTPAKTAIGTLFFLLATVPITLNVAASRKYNPLYDAVGPAKELSTFSTEESIPVTSRQQQQQHIVATPVETGSQASPILAASAPIETAPVAIPPNDAPFNFSACLLVKDDNKVLPEWLAYHYEVLPLRNLILGLDPYIMTNADHILNKFRELGMNIEVWKAEDFLVNGEYTAHASAPDEEKFKGHYKRQEAFMSKCLRRQRELNRTWTLLVDSDEYLTFHNFEGPTSEGMHRDCKTFDPVTRAACIDDVNKGIQNGTLPRGRLPRIGEATIADYIHSERNNTESMLNNYSCIVLPRVWLSANESPDRRLKKRVPKGFDPKAFVTLRYRHHSYFQNRFPGKSIVDVSRVEGEIVVGNPHRVLGSACKYGPFVNTGNSLFRIHHYVGSPEVFLFRPGDTHRTPEEFEKRNGFRTVGTTDATRGWLESFVNRVGAKKAMEVTIQLRQWGFDTDAKISVGSATVAAV